MKKCDKCDQTAALYRQCGRGNCKHEIAYCNAHGGDDKATTEMIRHIAANHAPKP